MVLIWLNTQMTSGLPMSVWVVSLMSSGPATFLSVGIQVGNPVTTLGPTEGYWNVGLGVQYSPQPNYFIAGGVKYFWSGDAKAQTGAQAEAATM